MYALLLAFAMTGFTGDTPMFLDVKADKKVDVKEVVDRAKNYDVIIFGEKHDSEDCHKAELILLKELRKTYSLTFSLEMFERDVQNILDDYLKNNINETEFLKESRPWSNYQTDYRPLIEYCKTNGVKVVASNIPRYIASLVAKGGVHSLDSLSEKEKEYLPDKVYYENAEYRKLFYQTMEQVHMPGFSDEMKENYYRAQCLKDATMAESILMALKKSEGTKVFHINGSFHSDYHLGVVFQLKKMDPSLKVLVIAPVRRGEDFKKQVGDYIFFYGK